MAFSTLFSNRRNQVKKKIYIASPFFNPDQLSLVMAVESAIIATPGLDYYSPRMDGVLKDMTPEARATKGPELFALNCKMIRECDSLLAIKDYKDTGTIWETGYAFALAKPMFALWTKHEPMNIMESLCFDAMVRDMDQLARFLAAYAAGTLGVAEFAVGKEAFST